MFKRASRILSLNWAASDSGQDRIEYAILWALAVLAIIGGVVVIAVR